MTLGEDDDPHLKYEIVTSLIETFIGLRPFMKFYFSPVVSLKRELDCQYN